MNKNVTFWMVLLRIWACELHPSLLYPARHKTRSVNTLCHKFKSVQWVKQITVLQQTRAPLFIKLFTQKRPPIKLWTVKMIKGANVGTKYQVANKSPQGCVPSKGPSMQGRLDPAEVQLYGGVHLETTVGNVRRKNINQKYNHTPVNQCEPCHCHTTPALRQYTSF